MAEILKCLWTEMWKLEEILKVSFPLSSDGSLYDSCLLHKFQLFGDIHLLK